MLALACSSKWNRRWSSPACPVIRTLSPSGPRGRWRRRRFRAEIATILSRRSELDRRSGGLDRGRGWSTDRLERAGESGRGVLHGENDRATRPAGADGSAETGRANSAAVFSVGVARCRDGQTLGTIMLLADFGPIASFLMDPQRSGRNGRSPGGRESRRGRSGCFCRHAAHVPVAEVTASGLPALSAASEGEFGFKRTTDYRGEDVLVSFRPVGRGFPAGD